MTLTFTIGVTLPLKLRVVSLFVCVTLMGCVSIGKQQGVTNKWRDPSLAPFEKGVTTQSDVINILGPPSQLISLKNQMVFYYLREVTKGKGIIFILFNHISTQVKYDRAIFFFDREGILTEYVYSVEQTPYDAAK